MQGVVDPSASVASRPGGGAVYKTYQAPPRRLVRRVLSHGRCGMSAKAWTGGRGMGCGMKQGREGGLRLGLGPLALGPSARGPSAEPTRPPGAPGRLHGRVACLFVLVGGLGVVCVRCLVGVLVTFGLRGGWGLVSLVR